MKYKGMSCTSRKLSPENTFLDYHGQTARFAIYLSIPIAYMVLDMYMEDSTCSQVNLYGFSVKLMK